MQTNQTQQIQVTVDRSLVAETNAIFEQLGLSQSAAITLFLKKVAATGRMPFDVALTERQKATLNLQAAIAQANRPVNDLGTPAGYQRWEEDVHDDY